MTDGAMTGIGGWSRRGVLAGAVLLLGALPAAALTPTPTTTPVYEPPGPFDVYGQVASNRTCDRGEAGLTVRLDPAGRMVTTTENGAFAFLDVPKGQVSLSVEPNCAPLPCYVPLELDLRRDTAVALCYQFCTPPTFAPATASPGGVVDCAGRCQDSEIGSRLQVYVDGAVVAEPLVDASGAYRASFAVPTYLRGVVVGVNIFNGDDLVAAGALPIANALTACVGDCNGDHRVSIDELLRGIAMALGATPPAACAAMDDSGNGVVTVAELVAAVDRALDGCRAPDLVPVAVAWSRCVERACTGSSEPTHFMRVCVVNQGDADAGSFSVSQGNQARSVFLSGLPPGGEACVELPFASDVMVSVDPFDQVPERDEDNNELVTSLPFPTACDVPGPPCTPTPAPSPTPT